MRRPAPSILRSAAVVGACTGGSRLLGFAREILMAVFFGTSLAKSAFDVAFTIPNLFRQLFGEGALSAAFVPVMTETLAHEGLAATNRFINQVMTLLALTLGIMVLGGVLGITAVLRWDVSLGARAAAVLPLLRIMFPYMFFICLVALCMAILNSFHHFAVPAATPVLLNLTWILTLLFICPHFGATPSERIVGVAVGILAAGAIQLAVQVPVLLKYGVRLRLSFAWRDPRVRRVLLLMGPAAVGMGVHQVNVCLDRILALWAAAWAPAALTFAERLIYLPLGVFATALGTVLLPTFSRQAAMGEHARMRSTLVSGVTNLMLVMIPAAVGLGVLALPIARLAFQWRGGEFDAVSALQTARAVRFYAPGLVVFSLYKILVPVFYALQDTRTPVRVGVGAVGLNLLLNVLFVLTWPADYKHAGLACATVLSSGVNSIVLAHLLKNRIGPIGWGKLAVMAGRVLLAALAMAVAVCLAHGWLADWMGVRGVGEKVGQLVAVAGSMAAGVAIYLLMATLLCPRQIKRLFGA